MKKLTDAKYYLIGIISAVIAVSLCCFGPLILLGLGLGGAYLSTLTHLEYLRPIGIIFSLVFLVLAFWKLYIVPKSCKIDKPCRNPNWLKNQRIIFWILFVLLIVVITFPWYAHLFY